MTGSACAQAHALRNVERPSPGHGGRSTARALSGMTGVRARVAPATAAAAAVAVVTVL